MAGYLEPFQQYTHGRTCQGKAPVREFEQCGIYDVLFPHPTLPPEANEGILSWQEGRDVHVVTGTFQNRDLHAR